MRLLKLAFLLSSLALFSMTVAPTYADGSILVTSTDGGAADDALCTLPEALIAAATDAPYLGCTAGIGVDLISFEAALFSTPQVIATNLVITSSVTINGPGANLLTIWGQGGHVIEVTAGVNLLLIGVTIRGGYAYGATSFADTHLSSGGGIYFGGANLTVIDSQFIENFAVIGGGIFAPLANLYIERVTFTMNYGGGRIAGYAILSPSAIYQQSGTLAIYSSTFWGNSGMATNAALDAGTMTVHNSTFGETQLDIGYTPDVTFSGHNNISTSDPCFSAGTCGLGTLGYYGGTTQTVPLLPGSPYIDAGDNTYCPATDQRGTARPIDGDGDGAAVCDQGAFETTYSTPTPVLTAPSGVFATSPAVFTWNVAPGAAWYYLWVSDTQGHVLDQWYDGYYICGAAECSVPITPELAAGSYQWWVQAWSLAGGYSAWSSPQTFIIAPPPAAPTLFAPAGYQPALPTEYQWNADPGAAWYYLWVSGEDGYRFDQWYDAYTICVDGVCRVPLDSALVSGTYEWWVQGWSLGGYGAWSDALTFTLGFQAPPAPIAPSGAATNAPTFTWNRLSGASWYYLWIGKIDDGTLILHRWYPTGDVCSGVSCSTTPTDVYPLAPGEYTWWISAWSAAGGYSTWSAGTPFTVSAP